MQDKIFIRISKPKPFTISQPNDRSSPAKDDHNPTFAEAISNMIKSQEQFQKSHKVKLPNTKQVSEILCNLVILRKEYYNSSVNRILNNEHIQENVILDLGNGN